MPSSKEGTQDRKSGASVLNHENNDKISKKKDTLSYLFFSKTEIIKIQTPITCGSIYKYY